MADSVLVDHVTEEPGLFWCWLRPAEVLRQSSDPNPEERPQRENDDGARVDDVCSATNRARHDIHSDVGLDRGSSALTVQGTAPDRKRFL